MNGPPGLLKVGRSPSWRGITPKADAWQTLLPVLGSRRTFKIATRLHHGAPLAVESVRLADMANGRERERGDDAKMSAFGTADLHGEESLIFGDMAELGGDVSAEERIKSLLGGDPAERGLARRRVVRRPFGSGGYQAQTIVFSERERERDGAQSLSSEPFSELLQLAATRSKGQLPLRASRDPAATESGRARVPGGGDGGSGAAVTPAQQLRAAFVQELLLSTLALPTAGLDPGPLDAGL